jgi:Domain of unknown function (DUF4386)
MNAVTAQQYARWVGVLYIVTIVAGGWGEAHVPNTLLMANDVAGTAQRVAASLGLFRASFAAYLLEAACDITLNVLLYALLRPVSRNLALLATCFGLMATSVYAAGEMLYFAAALPAVDADLARVISPEAKAALTYLCLTIYGYVNGIFAVFYGTAAMVRGHLILRSGYLPRALGAFFNLGGCRLYRQEHLGCRRTAVRRALCASSYVPGVVLLGALAADQGHRSRPMGCEADGTGNC